MIRSTVKKTDRFGVQGQVAFDPRNPNANVDLYRAMEKYFNSDQGLGGSGGVLANKIKDPRNFQATHVFNTPQERDDVTARLNKQMEEFIAQKFGKDIQSSGKSTEEFFQSQGITMPSYRNDDFILASQNPLRGSTEKKLQAYMRMAGNTQSIAGGTGEGRRHTGYYRPDDYKYARSMLNTTARKLNEGTGNLGDLEGVFLPAAQKLEVRAAQNIYRNGALADMMTNEKHPFVQKMRNDMLKQHAQTALQTKVRADLEKEGLLPPSDKPNRREKSSATKAMESVGMVVGKIQSVLSDMKSLFTAAVSYLRNIASEIGGLKQDAGTLGITTDQALQLKNLARMNPVYATSEDVFINAAKGVLEMTSDPSKVGNIKWDSVVLQKESQLIKPIIKAAVSGHIKPVDTMYTIYNTLGNEYYSADPKDRDDILTRQKAALASLDPSLASGYQTAIEVTKAYKLINKKNKHNMMGAFANHVEGRNSYRAINLSMGMGAGSSAGSEQDQKDLNDFLTVLEEIEAALRKFTMVRFDEIIRLLSSLIEAMLMLGSLLDGSNGSVDQFLKDFREGMKEKGIDQRAELANNYGIYRQALLGNLAKAGYTGANAENVLNHIMTASDDDAIANMFDNDISGFRNPELMRKYPDLLRNTIIIASKYRGAGITASDYDSLSEEDRRLVDEHNPKKAFNKNISLNRVLVKHGFDRVLDKGRENDLEMLGDTKMLPADREINEQSVVIDRMILKHEREKLQMMRAPADVQRQWEDAYQKSLQFEKDKQQKLKKKNGQALNLNLNKFMNTDMMYMGGAGGMLYYNNMKNSQNVAMTHKVIIDVNGKNILTDKKTFTGKEEAFFAEQRSRVTIDA